jgi:RES domain-containing protein
VAVAESRATADYADVPWPFRTPRLLVAIELSLQAVLDLTRPEVLGKLDLSAAELRAEDWRRVQETGQESLTQMIGRAVFTQGGEGMLVPSARVSGGVNVAYFPENQRTSSRVTVLEADKLERVRLAPKEIHADLHE